MSVGEDLVVGKTYRMIAMHSSQAVAVAGASKSSGADIVQWPQSDEASQHWALTKIASARYELVNKNSGQCLSVRQGAAADGVAIEQAPCSTNAQMLWKLHWLGSNYRYQLINRNSGKCLDVRHVSMDQGAVLQQWTCTDGNNQAFRFQQVKTPAPAPEPPGNPEQPGTPSNPPSTGTPDAGVTPPFEPSAPNGPVTIMGRQILVGGKPFHIRGVCWNPVKKGGTQPGGLDYAGYAPTDIKLMKDIGVNVVRTYEPILDTKVLDLFQAAGIRLLMGVYAYGANAPSTAVDAVKRVKDHPAILGWLLGNEWNYNGMYVGLSFQQSMARINEAAAGIKAVDKTHPIVSVYGELPSTETIVAMPNIDAWGLNVYRGISFGDLFDQWKARSTKPMFLAEYGADAYNAKLPGYDPASQAKATRALTQEIANHSSAREAAQVCSGGTIFEWSDEWWKAGNPNQQDNGGTAPGGGPYPDQTFNEEWWGIVSIDRELRDAYRALGEVYRSAP